MEYKRGLKKTTRELDREQRRLETQEKKITADMKKAAKADKFDQVKILAKDLIRTRNYCQKFQRMLAQIEAVYLRLMVTDSTATMAKLMAGVTRAMQSMNAQINVPAMQNIMREFEMQNEMMGLMEEIDLPELVMDEDGNEEEETELEIAKVMEEVGLDFKQKMGVNDTALPAAEKEPAQTEDDDALAARLAKLTGTMS